MAPGCIVAGTKGKSIFFGAVASKTAIRLTLTYPDCGSASEFYIPEEISLSHAGYVCYVCEDVVLPISASFGAFLPRRTAVSTIVYGNSLRSPEHQRRV